MGTQQSPRGRKTTRASHPRAFIRSSGWRTPALKKGRCSNLLCLLCCTSHPRHEPSGRTVNCWHTCWRKPAGQRPFRKAAAKSPCKRRCCKLINSASSAAVAGTNSELNSYCIAVQSEPSVPMATQLCNKPEHRPRRKCELHHRVLWAWHSIPLRCIFSLCDLDPHYSENVNLTV